MNVHLILNMGILEFLIHICREDNVIFEKRI